MLILLCNAWVSLNKAIFIALYLVNLNCRDLHGVSTEDCLRHWQCLTLFTDGYFI